MFFITQVPSAILRCHVRCPDAGHDILLLSDGQGAVGVQVHWRAHSEAGGLDTIETKGQYYQD